MTLSPKQLAQLARLEALRQATGRHCGSCTMCCHILGVDAPDLVKPPDTPCKHCRPGTGCTIYDRRPDMCRGFHCQWLLDSRLGDAWYPRRAKIVMHVADDGTGPCVVFEVDPRRPNRWLEQPYFEDISNIALGDVRVSVRVGKHWYLMLPRAALDDPARARITWQSHTINILPHLVGPGYVKHRLTGAEFGWAEMVPFAGSENSWRNQP
jgi:hypothetical protein